MMGYGVDIVPILVARHRKIPHMSMDHTDPIVLLFRLVVVLALVLWFSASFPGRSSSHSDASFPSR